jgi:Xaa-Pro dipeptidase
VTVVANQSLHVKERPERLRRLARGLAGKGVDAAVLLDFATVSYFTANHIAGPNVAIVTAGGACTVMCDEYDAYNFECLGTGLEIVPVFYLDDPSTQAAKWLADRPALRTVGVEFADMRLSAHRNIAAALEGRSVVPVDPLIADIRLPKSRGEVALIRQAAAAVEAAFKTAQSLLVGPTNERRLAAAIYDTLLACGSDYVAGQPYVKSGERALNTHARWSGRDIAPDEHVLLEIGGCVERYHAALMRTRLPKNPSPSVQRAVDAVRAGRDAHLKALRPGVTGDALHAAYLDALDRYGVRSWNRHSSGYPLGIAFPPYWGEIRLMTLTRGVTRQLEPGMALHVISGLTEPAENVAHVGLSECLLVTESGWERLINVDDFL